MYDEDFTPGGNLDSDINPYTGEKITSLDARTWADTSATELYKQLQVLENRFYIAQTLGKVEIVQQLQAAVNQLRSAIQDAIKRDSRRPTRKRPNSYEQTRPNNQPRTGFD